MSQFEFVSVAVSIVLALSAARLLSSLGHVFAKGRRYWIHALWCLILLAGHLTFWWAIWELHDVESWSFRAFAAAMLTPAILYLAASALVTEDPASVASWRAHYYARRRVFFALFIAMGLSVPLRQFAVVGDAELPLGFAAPILVFSLIGGAICIVAKGEHIHALLVAVLAALMLINLARL
jgi:hypothetical protein